MHHITSPQAAAQQSDPAPGRKIRIPAVTVALFYDTHHQKSFDESLAYHSLMFGDVYCCIPFPSLIQICLSPYKIISTAELKANKHKPSNFRNRKAGAPAPCFSEPARVSAQLQETSDSSMYALSAKICKRYSAHMSQQILFGDVKQSRKIQRRGCVVVQTYKSPQTSKSKEKQVKTYDPNPS